MIATLVFLYEHTTGWTALPICEIILEVYVTRALVFL